MKTHLLVYLGGIKTIIARACFPTRAAKRDYFYQMSADYFHDCLSNQLVYKTVQRSNGRLQIATFVTPTVQNQKTHLTHK